MTKTNWLKFKKQLPRNHNEEAAKILLQQGLQLTAQTVRDVIRNKITDPETQQKVWQALRQVKTNYQKKRRRIKKLQNSK